MRKPLKLLIAAAFSMGVLAAAPAAFAGEVTVHDPVHNCDHTYGWNIDTANPQGTRVYSKNDCTG
jgi:hypothetical protein